ncbi:polysaccharide deacetylase family protein [Leeuwenhoekiella parthenopeia]|uniref:Polysaccharide deacetylase family protein n=1 Tax=Leeuwenhoekiella parthenopeia TaxID=2890320 RepID=A0ABS8GRF0_9FLAO|nr:polysaccharide deacetylase family protein [Leeuwenhoekiella parthenopeia]MCC4212525.1 polysaccharide deacetylase family protein [Leeuwenhoekiella parthenopeia]
MLLVYTHKITPRLRYTFKHICTYILGIPVKFTSAVDEFIVHDSLKLSYTNKPLGKELFIKSQEVLFEQGIADIEIKVQAWRDTKCFFVTGPKSLLPFDIFAASFVLLSRYEEFLPHVKDEMGRFPATESLGYQEDFLNQPVIDIWASYFKEALKESYPNYDFPERKFSFQALVDVEQAYEMNSAGVMRWVSGLFSDLFRLKFQRIWLRFQVSLGLRKDPFDTFSWLINVQKNAKFKFLFFFQLGDYSTYTKNIRFNKRTFRELIKMVGDYSEIGLLFSKEALEAKKQMKIEKKRLENIINKPLNAVRCSTNMGSLPVQYREMIQLEAKNDYSMGYPNVLGFRAGTCTPFFFYDLDYESITPLKLHPICAQPGAFEAQGLDVQELNHKLDIFFRIKREIEQVNGTFVFSFSNKSVTGKGQDQGQWKQFFRELVNA